MTLQDLKDTLETTELPVTYHSWPIKKVPPLPYICYLVTYSNNFAADNSVYHKANHIQIELYTKNKDQISEEKVEKALSSFFWEKTEIYLDSEKCYQIVYEIEV